MDNKHKHLDLVQNVIARFASNSFLLKGWSVTLVSALLAVGATRGDSDVILLAVFPLVAFWLLDGYYLRTERCYRAIYNRVRAISDEQIDFSMDADPSDVAFKRWVSACFSATVSLFHGAALVVLLVVWYQLKPK